MTDTPVTPSPVAPSPVAADPILKFSLPHLDGEHTFDVQSVPAETRLDLLKGAIRAYVANRVNSTYQRHQKDTDVLAWGSYDEATKADPLQTIVSQPTNPRPAAPDLAGALAKALADLAAGNTRRMGDGEPKARVRKDPLIALVTQSVVRDVFEARKSQDSKYTFLAAKAEVGSDGIAYLNAQIEAKVALGVDRTALEKMRDQKYVGPAKTMLGLSDTKSIRELPSIL